MTLCISRKQTLDRYWTWGSWRQEHDELSTRQGSSFTVYWFWLSKTGNKERGFPENVSHLTYLQSNARWLRTDTEQLFLCALVGNMKSPLFQSVPMFSHKMDQTNYFFTQNDENNNLSSQMVKSLHRYWKLSWLFWTFVQDKIRNWLIEANTLCLILSDMSTQKYQHLIETIICSSHLVFTYIYILQRKLTSFCLIYCCWRTEAQWMQQLPRYIWVLSPPLHSGPDYRAPCTCILHQLKPTNCARIVHHGYLAFSLHQLSTTATLHQCWYTLQLDHRR